MRGDQPNRNATGTEPGHDVSRTALPRTEARGALGRLRAAAVFAAVAAAIACSPGASSVAPAAGDDAGERLIDDAGDAGVLEDAAGESPNDDASACPSMPNPRPFVRGVKVYARDGALRVNHLQAKASHNSYHRLPATSISEWNYEHVPLDEQLERQGVRGFELDLQWDEPCERFRVFHLALVDARTTCAFFTDCLLKLRGWSEAHPGHHPIFVHLEPKNGFGSVTLETRLQALEREILSVFDKRWILTPDDVKGASSTLAEALTTRGWPTLGEARGRFLFYFDNDGPVRDAYTHGRTDLSGRLVFADGRTGEPFVGVRVLNDPQAQTTEIAGALAQNIVVRTRADSNPADARAGLTAQRDAAFASGAQLVSTDFPAPVEGVPYAVAVPGGTPSRCNPVAAPAACTSTDIEDPEKLGR